MNILNKIRSLSEKKRKIIFWIIAVLVIIVFFNIYAKGVQNILKESEGKEFLDQSYFEKLPTQINKIKQMIFDNIKNKE